jgi:hypothetical protein
MYSIANIVYGLALTPTELSDSINIFRMLLEICQQQFHSNDV